MSGQEILCASCGITLRPFMKVCPRCGEERAEATPLEPIEPVTSLALSPPLTLPDIRPLPPDTTPTLSPVEPPESDPLHQPPGSGLYLSPPDTERRFPRFTSAQLTLIVIGILLLLLGSVIAWLLWRQQLRDERRDRREYQTTITAPPSLPASPSPSPTPTADQRLEESVRGALVAYNPFGSSRYSFTVVDGVVTIDGDAEHRPEKQGVENVVRLVAGVKSVVNRLRVIDDGEEVPPTRLNRQEARLLEEALLRQLDMPAPQAAETATPNAAPTAKPTTTASPAAADAQRETERLRRELAAARQRADELARRQAAEEALRRQTEDYLRREEETRQAGNERPLRATPLPPVSSALRSGSVAWSGIIDGEDEILFSGSSASVRHLSGLFPREVRASFSAPIPAAAVSLTLVSTIGRGTIRIAQQPSADNGYTAIVRLDDSRKGGEKRYEFTLRWSM